VRTWFRHLINWMDVIVNEKFSSGSREKRKRRNKNNSARRLGNLGYIPAIMYGLDREPVSIKVKRKI